MNDRKKAWLGVLCGLCVVFIALGVFAGISIKEIYATTNNVAGEAIISEYLKGDKDDFVLSDDESVFYSYSPSVMEFDDHNTKYVHKITAGTMKLDPDKTYTIYFNGMKVNTLEESGRLSCTAELKMNLVGTVVVNCRVKIAFEFYNDRTELTITVATLDEVGYLNQMSKTGINIRIVESDKANGPTISEDLYLEGLSK